MASEEESGKLRSTKGKFEAVIAKAPDIFVTYEATDPETGKPALILALHLSTN